jgi:hypothetical protein
MTTAIIAFNGIPSFFRYCCQEASAGGARGYKQAGWALAQNLYRLIPDELDRADWLEQLDDLETLLKDERHAEVETWLAERFPRCLALVPKRRRTGFFKGFREALEDSWDIG